VRRCPNSDTSTSYTYRTLKVDKVYEIIHSTAKSLAYNDRLPPKYDYRPYYETIVESLAGLKAAP